MKRSKKAICYITTICMVFALFSAPAFASSVQTTNGTALIPYFSCSAVNDNNTWLFLSNITDDPVDVTITFYNSDGTLMTDDGSKSTGLIKTVSTLSNYSDANNDSSVTYTLSAHNLCILTIGDNATSKRGYGVIQWSQGNSSAVNALIGWSFYQYVNSNQFDRTEIPVNGGMPF